MTAEFIRHSISPPHRYVVGMASIIKNVNLNRSLLCPLFDTFLKTLSAMISARLRFRAAFTTVFVNGAVRIRIIVSHSFMGIFLF